MKHLICVAVLGAFAATSVMAQQPAKNVKKTTATGGPRTALKDANSSKPVTVQSNEELNLDAYVQLLRTDLNKSRSQIISEVMQFDAEQAAAFWPIYKDFQAENDKVGDQIVDLVKQYVENYDNLTNEVADQLATKLFDIEQQRNDIKRKYYTKFKNALDATTAVRFLQVENQIEKLVDLKISSELPVAGGAGK